MRRIIYFIVVFVLITVKITKGQYFLTNWSDAPLIIDANTTLRIYTDERYCKFYAANTAQYFIESQPFPYSYDTYGKIYNSDGDLLAGNDDWNSGVDYDFGFLIDLEAGKLYYLSVYNRDPEEGFTDDWITINITGGGVLPVELNSFTVNVTLNKVLLNWQTSSEKNNYGFDIERKTNDWEKIGFVSGSGNSNSTIDYSFIDENPSTGVSLYRLKQIDNDGKFKYSQIQSVLLNAPKNYELLQNSPNPFNPSTLISFNLPEDSYVSLIVYDILGNEVTTLVNDEKQSGLHKVFWNGKDQNGKNASSGIYFYRIQAGKFASVCKMNLIR